MARPLSRIEHARVAHEQDVQDRMRRDDHMDLLVEAIIREVDMFKDRKDPRLPTLIAARIHGWLNKRLGLIGADTMAEEATKRRQEAEDTGHVVYNSAR